MQRAQQTLEEVLPKIAPYVVIILGLVLCLVVSFVYYYFRLRNAAIANRMVRCYTDWKCKDLGGAMYSPVSEFLGRLYSCRPDNFTTATTAEGEVVCACPISWTTAEGKNELLTCDNEHNGNPTEQKGVSGAVPEGFGFKSCSEYILEVDGTVPPLLNPDGTANPDAKDAAGVNPCAALWASRFGTGHDRPPIYTWTLFAERKPQVPKGA